MTAPQASTERFTDRVASYVRARPGYPAAIAPHLAAALQLPAAATLADLGSGTGLSCEPFLRAGFAVIGVEPNAAMRAAGNEYLAAYPRFRSVAGTAEATTLPPASVDMVIAAQAFHWFDVARCRAETLRIGRGNGEGPRAALIWNDRDGDGTPFAIGYEQLLHDFGTDYAQIKHRHVLEDAVTAFFGGTHWQEARFPNPTDLDWQTLVERVNSASYIPGPDSPSYAPMLARLRALFDATALAAGGADENTPQLRVRMDYTTRVFMGKLAR